MTNYADDDRPHYEFHHELEGLRRQNDQLREMVYNLRAQINGYRNEAEEAVRKMRQMEDARAGVTGARHFFQRTDGAENVVPWHYTIDGTRSVCRSRIEPTKYALLELAEPPEGLCTRCASMLQTEIQYNHYVERDASSKKDTTERHNNEILKALHATTAVFTTYVYLIQAENETRFKVGISIDPRKRLADLRHAAGRVLKILYISEPCTSFGAREVERLVKDEFDRRRVAQEWYQLSWQQVKRVKEIITLTVAQDRNKAMHIKVVK